MKKLLALIITSCFAVISLSPAVSAALGIDCGCITECSCGINCCCPPEIDCDCNNECTCEIILCYACDMIIKQREMLERQNLSVVSAFIIDVNPPLTIITVKFDILRICTANIVEAHIRMNN